MWRKVGCIVLIAIVIAVAALVIVKQKSGDGTTLFNRSSGKQTDKDQESYFKEARIGDLELTVQATGSTEPVTDIDVMSEATGRIIEFYVQEGDLVDAGDLICKLDQSNQQLVVQQQEIRVKQSRLAYEEARAGQSTTQRSGLESALDSAESNLDSAQDAYDKEQATFERVKDLHGKGYASEQELENAERSLNAARTSLESATASRDNAKLQLAEFDDGSDANAIEQSRLNYEAAKVALSEARKQLGDAVIASPIKGIILEKLLDIGDSVVSINSSFGGSMPIVRVADMSRINVRTSVDEIDIGKIEIGQQATVTVDAYRAEDFQGTVTNVFPQGVSSGTGLVNFIVLVEVDNSDNLLYGNMTSDVRIVANELKGVLLIPLAATRAGEEPDTDIVHKLDEGEDEFDKDAKTTETTVQLGETDYQDIIVLDGLEEGDMVKVRGFKATIQFGG